MRKGSLVTAAIVVLAVSACKGKDTAATSDDLAKDIALASSSDGLALAPKAGSQQMVVSAEELSPQARPKMAPSSKSSRPVAHRTPHRDHVPQRSSEVAAVAAPSPSSAAAPAPEVAVTPAPTPADAPVVEAPRPHPVAVSYPSNGSGDGGINGGGSGGGIGAIIGAIGGAVLRGGVVDGDHCDPRSERRNGGHIAINSRMPVIRGTF